MDIILGIDLGTTYSSIGVWENKVTIIPDKFGNRTVASCVYINNNNIIVGEGAKKYNDHIYCIKRFMGKTYDENLANSVNYKIINNNGKYGIVADNKIYSPEEISAMILKYLKDIAENYLQKEIKKVIITVPAYFSNSQREATMISGQIAGLDVINIINEPTAASLAYSTYRNSINKNILVYDLGGGTFDVTILYTDNVVFDVLSTTGDTMLGGEDFTNNLVEYCYKLTGIKNRIECENIKKQLTHKKNVDVIFSGKKINITREIFNEINNELFNKTLICVEKAISCANLTKEDISEIILIGGSTRIPYVQTILSNYFNGKQLNKSINPDEAVAYGAVIKGNIIQGINNTILLDVTPLSLGIEIADGIMHIILPRCSKIPNNKSKYFTTMEDNQEALTIKIFEGESLLTKECILLGSFTIDNIPPMPRGVPKINVCFFINSDSLLVVSAEIENNINIKKKIEIKNNFSISKEEIEKMIKKSKENMEIEVREKNRIYKKIELENLIGSLKYVKDMSKYEKIIKDNNYDELHLTEIIEELKKIKNNSNI